MSVNIGNNNIIVGQSDLVSIKLNDYVKIKLTDVGIKILKGRHDELNSRIANNGGVNIMGEFKLRLDKDGYYKMQLWDLINTFGDNVDVGLDIPFESKIITATIKANNKEAFECLSTQKK
ncbi:hypothetical protein [Clostridium estertheticum]|uniref:hypothetical protein n=1 Tax=Clostridium estertheticum TaxID=238834 RepID=UPI001C7CEE56|nr:hypothetical protein [Clostridium estertheticum]MBX4266552.1 hypothetical protein [Clostridium estertheticum]WLC88108.1 hypothetical protein KTC95_19135 [Clostridium estertheticum]